MIDDSLIARLTDAFGQVQQHLFEVVVQPVAFALGWGNLLEDAYEATGWMMVGVIQLAVMLCLIAPLQRWRPVERQGSGVGVRVDVLYTLIHRLGLFRVAMFFSVEPLLDFVFGEARVWGLDGIQLDAIQPPHAGLAEHEVQQGLHREKHRHAKQAKTVDQGIEHVNPNPDATALPLNRPPALQGCNQAQHDSQLDHTHHHPARGFIGVLQQIPPAECESHRLHHNLEQVLLHLAEGVCQTGDQAVVDHAQGVKGAWPAEAKSG